MVVVIRRLVWEPKNIKHLLRHGVSPDEVKEVYRSDYLVLRGKAHGRLVLVGKTAQGKIIEVVVQPKGKGLYYVVTAYPAGSNVISLYRRRKGGEPK